MHDPHERWRVVEAINHMASGLPGLPGIVVGAHAEIGISALDWRMDHVAGDRGATMIEL